MRKSDLCLIVLEDLAIFENSTIFKKFVNFGKSLLLKNRTILEGPLISENSSFLENFGNFFDFKKTLKILKNPIFLGDSSILKNLLISKLPLDFVNFSYLRILEILLIFWKILQFWKTVNFGKFVIFRKLLILFCWEFVNFENFGNFEKSNISGRLVNLKKIANYEASFLFCKILLFENFGNFEKKNSAIMKFEIS